MIGHRSNNFRVRSRLKCHIAVKRENRRRVCSPTDVWTEMSPIWHTITANGQATCILVWILLYWLDKSFSRHIRHTDAHRYTQRDTVTSNLDEIQHPSAHPPTPLFPIWIGHPLFCSSIMHMQYDSYLADGQMQNHPCLRSNNSAVRWRLRLPRPSPISQKATRPYCKQIAVEAWKGRSIRG